MSESDQEAKTEEATPRKQEQLREKGSVASSPDVAGAATVVASLGALFALGGDRAAEISRFAERVLRLEDVRSPFSAMEAFSNLLLTTVMPVAAAAALAAIIATVVQTRGLFALASIEPKLDRLDPISGMKKVLPSPQMLMELGKSLVKVSVVAWLIYRVIARDLPRFAVLPRVAPDVAAAEVAGIAMSLVAQGVLALSLLAAIDYFIAWRRFQKEARMEKHEIKQEHKESDGDPHIKAKRRQKQREMASKRAVSDLKTASVLVTNPTHISVALRYDPKRGDAAPIMLSYGVDEVALRMRTEARKLGIPIIENKPLARALKATGKVGRPIPVELYEVAARVIAHVMKIRGVAA